MIVGVVGAALATLVGRATGAGWLPAVGLALLLGVGLYLWARDEDKGWGDLGEGIMVSVVVAIALMAVQRDADNRTREATERRDRELRDADAARQQAAERENLHLSLTTQNDLRGIALADRDMHGFLLAGKDFTGADLHGANLEGADLRGSVFRRTNLLRADLDKANLVGADLRGAILSPRDERSGFTSGSPNSEPTTFREADLQEADLRRTDLWLVDFTEAHLTGADLGKAKLFDVVMKRTFLIAADLHGVELRGADLSEAVLDGARFCGASGLRRVRLPSTRSTSATRWPPSYDPLDHGAVFLELWDVPNDDLRDADYRVLRRRHLTDYRHEIQRSQAGAEVFVTMYVLPLYPRCNR